MGTYLHLYPSGPSHTDDAQPCITLPLSSTVPDLGAARVDSCQHVAEDAQYKLRLSSDEIDWANVDRVTVSVNGREAGILYEPQEVSTLVFYDGPTGWGGEQLRTRPFQLYYDLVTVSVNIRFLNTHTIELYSGYLLCGSSSEEDAQDIRALVQELLTYDDAQIGAWLFERGQRVLPARDDPTVPHYAYRSLSSYIDLLERVTGALQEHYAYFANRGKHAIVHTETVRPYNDVKSISRRGFDWLMQNLTELDQVSAPTGITYRGAHYLPRHMLTTDSIRTADVYENRVIVDFLYTVHASARDALRGSTAALAEDGMRAHWGADQDIEDAPIFTIQSLFVSFLERQQRRLRRIVAELDALLTGYRELFGVHPRAMHTIPRLTNTFREIPAYALVFQRMLEWFRYGEFQLTRDESILHIKTLDKLFEYYCLCRLLSLFAGHGFTNTCASFHEYGVSDGVYRNETDIANTYVLQRGDTEVTVYYQPVIGCDGSENGLGLYRTTAPRQEEGYPYFTPDFVLRISRPGQQAQYVILDAKFAKRSAVRQYHMSSVLLKYACQLATTDRRQAAMVWILQGRQSHPNEQTVEHWQNSDGARRYGVPVSFGIANVNPREGSRTAFEDRFWHALRDAMPDMIQ